MGLKKALELVITFKAPPEHNGTKRMSSTNESCFVNINIRNWGLLWFQIIEIQMKKSRFIFACSGAKNAGRIAMHRLEPNMNLRDQYLDIRLYLNIQYLEIQVKLVSGRCR